MTDINELNNWLMGLSLLLAVLALYAGMKKDSLIKESLKDPKFKSQFRALLYGNFFSLMLLYILNKVIIYHVLNLSWSSVHSIYLDRAGYPWNVISLVLIVIFNLSLIQTFYFFRKLAR